jgi:hypothetical protein
MSVERDQLAAHLCAAVRFHLDYDFNESSYAIIAAEPLVDDGPRDRGAKRGKLSACPFNSDLYVFVRSV